MKFCSFCGSQNNDDANVCGNCGTAFASAAPKKQTYGIAPRSIAVAIILSLVTCGIYSIYWFVMLTNETNKLANSNAASGGKAYLFTLLTCGIYSIYWAYKMGEKVDAIKKTQGSSGVLYLILSLFGLGIVVYCLAQDTVNKAVQK